MTRSKLTTIPDDFGLTPELRAWAQRHGFTQLEERMEFFIDYCKAGNGSGKPRLYADFCAAFRNSVRADWAKLNRMNGSPKASQSLPWLEPKVGESTEHWMARRAAARH